MQMGDILFTSRFKFNNICLLLNNLLAFDFNRFHFHQ
jgi:hypothetical protein